MLKQRSICGCNGTAAPDVDDDDDVINGFVVLSLESNTDDDVTDGRDMLDTGVSDEDDVTGDCDVVELWHGDDITIGFDVQATG